MSNKNNPFGNPIVYTNPAAIFRAYIQIDGNPAENGDTVAIYVGNELRCVQEVQIINSNAIEKSKETVNSHYDKALNSLSNIPQSEYSKALESIIEISRNRIWNEICQ